MLTTLAFLSALAAPQGPSNPPVVINEFAYDQYVQSGASEILEFVELYNRTNAPVDISGWTLTNTNYNPAVTVLVYTVPPNTTLAAGAFYVMGNAVIPNVNQVLTPTGGFTELFRNDKNALTIKDSNGAIVDTVVYENNQSTTTQIPANLYEGEAIWDNHQNASGFESGYSRLRDGYDTNNNGRDFRCITWTPGATNNRPNLVPYLGLYDAFNNNDNLPEFGASYKYGRAVDPTVVVTPPINPNVIPASPQGGKAAIFWDETGGGNMNMLLTDVGDEFVLESWVYFDSRPEVGGEYETWSIGVTGGSGGLYNTPDPSRTLFTVPSANGNTGISWTFQNTATTSILYLIDHNDGGPDWKIIGQVSLQQGVNDGWQRLRLQVSGDKVEGYFGGTFGGLDGTRITGKRSAPQLGGIYVGYREFVGNNGTTRPPTVDLLSISTPVARVERIGVAKATTVGTPDLDAFGFPRLGDAGFRLDLSGLKPNQNSVLLVGSAALPTPIDLGLFGGQSGSFLYINTLFTLNLATGATGTSTLPLPLPNNPSFQGATLFFQDFDLDTALGIPLPFGNTNALKIVVGS